MLEDVDERKICIGSENFAEMEWVPTLKLETFNVATPLTPFELPRNVDPS